MMDAVPPPAPGLTAPAQDPLSTLRWESRVLLIFAEDPADAARQNAILATSVVGLRDRAVTVFVINAGVVTRDGQADTTAPASFQGYRTSAAGFEAVLIGLDGGLKQRWTDPVPAKTLFAVIDAMPMRRQELRQQSDG